MNRFASLVSAACLSALLLETSATAQVQTDQPEQLEQEELLEEKQRVEHRKQLELLAQQMEEAKREQEQRQRVEEEATLIGPPNWPLERGEMKRWEYDILINIGYLFSEDPYNQEESLQIQCNSTQLTFPLVMEGTNDFVNPDSIKVSGMIGDQWQSTDLPWSIRGPHPDGTAEIVLDFPAIDTDAIGMRIRWKAESWQASIDEHGASRVPWPTYWPKEAEQFLTQSTYIDSTSNEVVNFVTDITNDRQREVPIYLAAKEIVRHVVTHFFTVGPPYGSLGLSGNNSAIATGRGTRGDMTCLAVGCLRAAGIPARPVLGFGTYWSNSLSKFVKAPIIWGEFYLPGCGWVFFDPFEMHGKGIKLKSLDASWPWFGSERDRIERTPLSYRLERPGNPSGRFCADVEQLQDAAYGNCTDCTDVDISIDPGAYRWNIGVWGWMVENCNTYGCDERRSITITRINRTGSLFD